MINGFLANGCVGKGFPAPTTRDYSSNRVTSRREKGTTLQVA